MTVVCGAPNVRENILVPIAKTGSKLGDFKIKKTKIRDVISNGMICSEKELGLSDEHEGIMILDSNLKKGQGLGTALSLEEDTMGTVFNSYLITWNQPWRILFYNLVLFPLVWFSQMIFSHSINLGFMFINFVFGNDSLMGEKLNNIVGTAANIIWPKDIGFSSIGADAEMYSYFSIPLSTNTLSGTECIASFIIGFFLLLITISWLSYTLSIITVGETLTLSIY